MNEQEIEKYQEWVERAQVAERRVRQLAQALAAYAPAHPLLVDASTP